MSRCPRIVLTGSAADMSNHWGKIFTGFGACISNPPFPLCFVKRLFYPPVSNRDGRADYAPYALRKIEARLLENGFDERDVVVAHPNQLDSLIGPETKAVGITVMDPLGLGPTSQTFSSILNGESATYSEFKKLMNSGLLTRYGARVIAGGMGTWQLYRTQGAQERYRISTLVMGEGEKAAPELFWKAVNGEKLPKTVFAEDAETELIPAIRNPSVAGLIEISRGCGRNCKFCIPSIRGKRDMPIDRVVQEVRVNARAGCAAHTLHAEDALMYGSGAANRFQPNREKVMKLFTSVYKETGKPNFGISHTAPSTIAADPKLVEDISELLEVGKGKRTPLFGFQTGIETGSTKIMKKYMAGKPLPFKVEEWPEVVTQAFGISKDHGWIPAATLLMGLPDETADDVNRSLELMDRLRDCPSFIVPQFFIPLTETVLEGAKMFDSSRMLDEHWQLLARCLDHSVRWADYLRRLYFSTDPMWLRVLYWFGYRMLYLFAWFGGRAAVKRMGLDWERYSKRK